MSSSTFLSSCTPSIASLRKDFHRKTDKNLTSVGLELLSDESSCSLLRKGITTEDGVLSAEKVAVDIEGASSVHFCD
jgi:hypothetical protein